MQKQSVKLGISPCPNDTFAFDHFIRHISSLPFSTELVIEDVETLNRMMLAGELDITKVSFHALGHAASDYILLRSGSALGRGCGPLLLAGRKTSRPDLSGKRIAIPGRYTTAALLLRLFAPEASNLVSMTFSRIPEAVQHGRVDAGLVIHEIRFTYRSLDLVCIQDLGEWWENSTGMPIPLGGIAAKRSLPGEWIVAADRLLAESIEKAWKEPEKAVPFMRKHAADMSEDVMKKHVRLYVNHFTADLGEEGEKAVNFLFQKGVEYGIFRDIPDDTVMPPYH